MGRSANSGVAHWIVTKLFGLNAKRVQVVEAADRYLTSFLKSLQRLLKKFVWRLLDFLGSGQLSRPLTKLIFEPLELSLPFGPRGPPTTAAIQSPLGLASMFA